MQPTGPEKTDISPNTRKTGQSRPWFHLPALLTIIICITAMTYTFRWENGMLHKVSVPFSIYFQKTLTPVEGYTGYYRGRTTHIETWPYIKLARMFNTGKTEYAHTMCIKRLGYSFLFSLLPPLWGEYARALALNAIFWFLACVCLMKLGRRFFSSPRVGYIAALLAATDFSMCAMSGDAAPHLWAGCWFLMGVWLAAETNFIAGKPNWKELLVFALWAAGGGLGYNIQLMLAAFGILIAFPRLSIGKIIALPAIAFAPGLAFSIAIKLLGHEDYEAIYLKRALAYWADAYRAGVLTGLLSDIKLFLGFITAINPLLLLLGAIGFPSMPREMKKIVAAAFVSVLAGPFIFSHSASARGYLITGFVMVFCLVSANGLCVIADRLSGFFWSKSIRRVLFASVLVFFLLFNFGMAMSLRFTAYPGLIWAFTWGGPPHRVTLHTYLDRLPLIEKL
ncbi:MAG: hypothetical protein ABIH66_02365 [bacterium]